MPRLRLLSHPAVASAIGREIGRDIEYHARLRSTQTRARELAAQGAVRGVVVADVQDAGQGTHERVWVAPAGSSLLASWIIRPAPAAPALFAALEEWRERSTLLGRAVEVRLDGRAFGGTATAIDDEGALIVHTADGVERVVSGDVRLA